VRGAAIQLSPVFGELEDNRKRAARAIEEAASLGAELVVLPELCISGYVFTDAFEARALSEPVAGETVAGWSELAAKHELTIVGGICERDELDGLHNSAVVVDKTGLIASYRKTHLWNREQLVFTPGTRQAPVVDTDHGRIGLAICYDSFFPEVMRGLALAGAEVIVVPMNSPVTDPPFLPVPVEVSLVIASAAVNRVFVIQADRTRAERGVGWAEASCIVDPDGRLLAGPNHGRAVLVADLDLGQARDKSYGERNDVLADRRVDMYEIQLPVPPVA
jgi:5-aminopentanamidase